MLVAEAAEARASVKTLRMAILVPQSEKEDVVSKKRFRVELQQAI